MTTISSPLPDGSSRRRLGALGLAAVAAMALTVRSLIGTGGSAGTTGALAHLHGSAPAVGTLGEAERLACEQPLGDSTATSEDAPEPPVVRGAPPGFRANMRPFALPGGRRQARDLDDEDDDLTLLPYQLFLPASWTADGAEGQYPVVVFLHGAGDGKFSVMNSQSLPRLLAADQSTVFDSRACWCLDPEYEKAEAMREAPPSGSPSSAGPFLDEIEELRSPMANCTFAADFGGIVVMPQGWLPSRPTGWTPGLLRSVEILTRDIIRTYRGDPERVVLTGQSAGGSGAATFATSRPGLWSAVNVICSPWVTLPPSQLEGRAVWIVGDAGDGESGNDEIVAALKRRKSGDTRYTRYVKAPGPPDPKYRSMLGHASYDLIYRDPRLWEWAFAQRNPDGNKEWAV